MINAPLLTEVGCFPLRKTLGTRLPLLIVAVAVAIHVCQSVSNESHGRKRGSDEEKFRKRLFAGNATVSVFFGSYTCNQMQSYTKGHYNATKQGEYYHIYPTGEIFHRSQVFFHEDSVGNKTIFVCRSMISLHCQQISLSTHINLHVCRDGYDSEVIYVRFREAASTVGRQTEPELFLMLRARKNAELIENQRETMKNEKQCKTGEIYNENFSKCQKPFFIVGEKMISVQNASPKIACIKKQTHLHANYTLEENGQYYIKSTGEKIPRKRVFFQQDIFSGESISTCERSNSLTCVQLNTERIIHVCQSVKNTSVDHNRTVIQFIDKNDFDISDVMNGSITSSFLETIAMPEETELKREECRPGETYVEESRFCRDFSTKYFFVKNETFPVFNTTFLTGNESVSQINATLSRRKACVKKKTYSEDDYTSIENGEHYYINSTGEKLPRNRVNFEGASAKNQTISVCEQIAFLTCAEVNSKNLTAYNLSEYGIQNETIFMCSLENPPKQIKWRKSTSVVAQKYLSLVCLSLSLACLFLVIQTYLIFSELRNLPGKNLLSLSISLFLAQLLWVIPDERYPPTLCHVAAVLKHYLFLVSFVAMAAIAWNTYIVFTTQKLPVQNREMKKSEKRKFYKYLALVWGLPAILVVTCAVVDEREIYAVDVNDRICWFHNQEPHKYLFILPLGLLQLFNIILFGLTVFHIQRTRSSTKSVRSDQRKKTMFWIYLKLSSLMGFSWLFGFVHLLVGSSTVVFAYLFVVFSSLQGVYIALAFVMKKRIRKMYAKLLKINTKKRKPGNNKEFSKNFKKREETRL